MSALVDSVAQKVDQDWRTKHCKKGNCSLSLKGKEPETPPFNT